MYLITNSDNAMISRDNEIPRNLLRSAITFKTTISSDELRFLDVIKMCITVYLFLICEILAAELNDEISILTVEFHT